MLGGPRRWPGSRPAPVLPRRDDRARPLLWAAGFGGHRGVFARREERGDDTWVELASGGALDLGDRSLDGPRGLVGSIVGERVKDVGHGDHSADHRDGLAGKSRGVPRAVPPLVMACGDDRGHLEHRRVAVGEQVRAKRGVGLHDLILLRGQLPRLEQDAVRDRELPDVVERGRLAQKLDLLRAEREFGRRSLRR